MKTKPQKQMAFSKVLMGKFLGDLKDGMERLKEEIYDTGTDRQRNGFAFSHWYLTKVIGLNDEDAFDSHVSLSGRGDKGLDNYWLDTDTGTVHLYQFKYHSPKLDTGVSETERPDVIRIFVNTINRLKNPDPRGTGLSSSLAKPSEIYLFALKRGNKVKMELVSLSRFTEETFQEAEAWRRNSPDNHFLELHDAKSIAERYSNISRTQQVALRVPKKFELRLSDNKCLEHTVERTKVHIAIVPLEELVRLVSTYGNPIFDENLRGQLGKTWVNKKIAETLKTENQRLEFFLYNNGIAILAKRADLKEGKLVLHGDVFIVNGQQTAQTLIENQSCIGNTETVLCRVVSTQDEEKQYVIAEALNSQNPISVMNLRATDKHQKRLKKELASLDVPWFYELRQKEWGLLRDSEKKKFKIPGKRGLWSYRIIRLKDCAKYIRQFAGFPHDTAKDLWRLFTEVARKGFYEELFPSDINYQSVLVPWVLEKYYCVKARKRFDGVMEKVAKAAKGAAKDDYLGTAKESAWRALKRGYDLALIGRLFSYVSRDTPTTICDSLEQVFEGHRSDVDSIHEIAEKAMRLVVAHFVQQLATETIASQDIDKYLKESSTLDAIWDPWVVLNNNDPVFTIADRVLKEA